MEAPSVSFMLRDGELVAADEVFFATFSADVPRMLEAMKLEATPFNRHFLLMAIVKESYKHRSDHEMRSTCRKVSEIHIKEFPSISVQLKKRFGILPRVPTFQHYATILLEDSEYDKAVEVCADAISHGLLDGTKAGYEGRIERIRKKQAKDVGNRAPPTGNDDGAEIKH